MKEQKRPDTTDVVLLMDFRNISEKQESFKNGNYKETFANNLKVLRFWKMHNKERPGE